MRARAAALAGEAASVAPEALFRAVDSEGRRRLNAFLNGIEAYRRHPYVRDLAMPAVVWREGTTTLYDYGGGGRPLLVIPSLVNRAYILDLAEDVSLMRWLAGRGLRPFLVDWGGPGAQERGFTLDDYVAGRLGGALNAVRMVAGDSPVCVLGYCMGGLLALALAQIRPREVDRLALLATPWDFHAGRAAQARAMTGVAAVLEPVMAATGSLDVDILQALFAALDPLLNARKFIAFAGRDPDTAEARHFVAVEDWANDGVPLAAPVARECLAGWYGENTPARGAWSIGGRAVDPATLSVPSLLVIPARDRIVPPASAAALAAALPQTRTLRATAGHIGMVAGRRAVATMWPMIADWLTARG